MKLKDQVCVVTGGGSGIGEAICLTFAREGGRVVVMDVDLESARRVAASVADGLALACDVADARSVDAAFAETVRLWGRVDVLVNNAGIVGKDEYRRAQVARELQLKELRDAGVVSTPLRATVQLSDEEWRRMLAIHLDGTFYCTRAALTDMERRGRGVIVNMSSINGLDGGLGNPHYAAAKAGILGFTKAVAKEAIVQGIRVNAVAPGFVETPIRESITPAVQRAQIAATPIGRAASAAEIAAAVLFLACDDASYFVGQTLSPNGGYLTR